jgi:SAM-dependent methyltransferase
LTRSTLPDWRLPPGVSHGLWDYVQADHIASDYDEYFAYNRLFTFDEEVLVQHFKRPGMLIDLGCGTGRLVDAFARRGFRTLAVDLSLPMLRIVGQKATAQQLAIDRLLANMVQLDCLADACADYCIIMFSSLGMVAGSENRLQVLHQVRRILKPGGLFALHVHNRWYNLYDPQGRRWLLGSLLGRDRRAGLEPGDKVFEYRGIPRMRLHLFTWSELRGMLRTAAFRIRTVVPLDTARQRELRNPWILGRIRANGWIVICE